MSIYHHILVALDGSADSRTALRHAVTLARDQNAKLTLLTVVPHTATPVGPGVAVPPETVESHNEIIKGALGEIPATSASPPGSSAARSRRRSSSRSPP